ncbi:MAG: hypothetical protein FWF69_09320 [Firmicutes bacterium]|nr:hypothetical protein [Bacillota bacterium]
MIIAGVAAMLIGIAALDLPWLIREKKRRELIVYAICLAAVSAYILLYALDVRFVTSLGLLHRFFEKTLGLHYGGFT